MVSTSYYKCVVLQSPVYLQNEISTPYYTKVKDINAKTVKFVRLTDRFTVGDTIMIR